MPNVRRQEPHWTKRRHAASSPCARRGRTGTVAGSKRSISTQLNRGPRRGDWGGGGGNFGSACRYFLPRSGTAPETTEDRQNGRSPDIASRRRRAASRARVRLAPHSRGLTRWGSSRRNRSPRRCASCLATRTVSPSDTDEGRKAGVVRIPDKSAEGVSGRRGDV